MPRPKAELILTDDERQTLTHLRQLRLGSRRKSFGDGPRIAPERYSWCHAHFDYPLKYRDHTA